MTIHTLIQNAIQYFLVTQIDQTEAIDPIDQNSLKGKEKVIDPNNFKDIKLETEILLAHVLKVTRSYLYTWPEKEVTPIDQERFYSLINRRKEGEPIAYIIGEKEFWSLPLKVTPDVLIPRPETELIVELVLNHFPRNDHCIRILDLGTGSGAISMALAKECPHWKIVATDASSNALEVAKTNAKNLSLHNIEFYFGNWFSALEHCEPDKKVFNCVVSNPPYIEKNDCHLNQGDLRFEPKNALISEDHGLYDLKYIIKNAKDYLAKKGCVIVEHSNAQSLQVTAMMQAEGFISIATHKDLANVNRVTLGCKA